MLDVIRPIACDSEPGLRAHHVAFTPDHERIGHAALGLHLNEAIFMAEVKQGRKHTGKRSTPTKANDTVKSAATDEYSLQ